MVILLQMIILLVFSAYDASPGPTPYHTPDSTPYHTPGIIPKSLPNTPKLGASNLKPTTTDLFYDANDF